MNSNILHNHSINRENLSEKDVFSFQDLCDEARIHIKNAISARGNDETPAATDHISQAIALINMLKLKTESAETGDSEGNLSNLFLYMADRLAIKHNTSGINPLDEVNWLLDSLKYIFRNHRSESSPSEKKSS